MRCLILSSILALAWFTVGVAEEKKDDRSPFAKKAGEVGGGAFMACFMYGFVPSISSWSNLKLEELPSLKEFPNELLQALDAPAGQDFETALTLVEGYAGVARMCASERGRKDLTASVHRVFAPSTNAIEKAVEKGLAAKQLKIRLQAARALLVFQPDHAKADAILAQGIDAEDKEFRKAACEKIGFLQLKNQGAINTLIRALRDREQDVRGAAAYALREIGLEAKSAIPGLVRLLESGESVHGDLRHRLAIALPQTANLAVAALTKMGPEARPAVPVLLKMFPKEKADDQRDLLACLAAIGPGAKDAIATIEKVMASEDSDIRFTAACAMTCVAPEKNAAPALINQALASKDGNVRGPALTACLELGPRSKTFVSALTALLDSDNENTRMMATQALARIGPEAAAAIPALEKLLVKADDHHDHTYLSLQAAAWALGCIGKASEPALIRAAAAKIDGSEYAVQALGNLGQDASPAAVACLIRIVECKDPDKCRFLAAIALGCLGDRAKSARRVLEKHRADEDLMGTAEWALMEIPE